MQRYRIESQRLRKTYTLLWMSFFCVRIEPKRAQKHTFFIQSLFLTDERRMNYTLALASEYGLRAEAVSCLNVLLVSDESVLHLTLHYYIQFYSELLHLKPHSILKS